MSYLAFILNDESRERLKEKYPVDPAFGEVLHHVTLYYNPPMPLYELFDYYKNENIVVDVVGIIEDTKAKALVCQVNGTIFRPKEWGGIFHITHSLMSGIRPVYSNTLLEKEWVTVKPPIRVFGHYKFVE
jgi:hypothetical protein